MTKFIKKALRPSVDFNRHITRFEALLKQRAEEEVRRYYRERFGLIYVREYTVPTHMRAMKKRKPAKPSMLGISVRELERMMKSA